MVPHSHKHFWGCAIIRTGVTAQEIAGLGDSGLESTQFCGFVDNPKLTPLFAHGAGGGTQPDRVRADQLKASARHGT